MTHIQFERGEPVSEGGTILSAMLAVRVLVAVAVGWVCARSGSGESVSEGMASHCMHFGSSAVSRFPLEEDKERDLPAGERDPVDDIDGASNR